MRKAFVIFFNLLISGLVVSFLFSCHRVKTPEEKCDSIKAVFRDSVVRLSFYGIELGASFTETMKKIKEVDNMSLYIDDSLNTCWGHVNIVTEKDESLQLNINITSYNDSIASIVLSTDDEDIANKVNYLYWQKYKFGMLKIKVINQILMEIRISNMINICGYLRIKHYMPIIGKNGKNFIM